ncbi:MAG: hypothetical protein C4520_02265 [Candidatus Abyssobacteria bacterium SURF_5]|uniref:Dipeptidylpeptidase IV N-terminal domain-containing protein n=1 Tax=Abyssobacteria bacterium (strain SURF_5) TaxID=2093360 RepID=A0A3A4P323_ABYX5|nr:MAG: hypothetical protein C4520_02265 [Candidatus Abyssubacteria bacterium SURF_5]
MKRWSLAVGICCFIAAAGIVVLRRNENPFVPSDKWRLSNEEYHGTVLFPVFSPDGEKLFFRVRNESGTFGTLDTYVYLLEEKTLRKLNLPETSGWIGCTPDSLHLFYTMARPHNRYFYDSYVYSVDSDSVVEKHKLMWGGWQRPYSPDGKWQLFANQMKEYLYMKLVGEPIWVQLPDILYKGIPYWSGDGKSILCVCSDKRKIVKYDIEGGFLSKLLEYDDFEVRPLLYPSPYANEAIVLTSRKLKEYFPVVLRKMDIDSGQITYSFDSALDPEGNAIGAVYFPPQKNRLYYSTNQYTVEGELKGEPPKTVILDTASGQTETLLSKEHVPRAYCSLRDAFAVTLRKDVKVLYLFDVKTRNLERIFPPATAAQSPKDRSRSGAFP